MDSLRRSNRQRFLVVILALFAIISALELGNIAASNGLGNGDFVAYWSASYLLREGRNPYDQTNMAEIERTQVHSNLDYTIAAWNPPTLFVFILPVTWLPFVAAKSVWLVMNVAILLLIALMLAYLYLPRRGGTVLAFCLFVVLFPQALLAILIGQVTFLVVLGVVSCMVLFRREQWFWAGFALILTSVKPHMAILAVPYFLLYAAYRRRWQVWLGLLCAGVFCILVLFLFRPAWITDIIGLVGIAPVNWATPTIGGFASSLRITEALRYVIVIFLPLAWFLSRPNTSVSVETSIALLTIITVPTTFFGWSYDQTILLIPIAQIFAWLGVPARNRMKLIVAGSILILQILTWAHRIAGSDDVYYVWIPLAWAALYGICFAAQRNAPPVAARVQTLAPSDVQAEST